MNKQPLISVIIPVYNGERWIHQACVSIIKQTYKNWELIVVDDGSLDNTYEILQKLSKSHTSIRSIHTENGGVCKARNIGLDEAQGEYIAFLDADDLLATDALEKMYNAINTQQADIVAGARDNINSNGDLLGCPYQKETGVLIGTKALEYSLKDHPSSYTVWGKLYKKSLIEDIRFVEGKRVNEDSFFVFQCYLKRPKVVLIDDIVVHYRITDNSASRAPFSEKFFDILYFAEQKKTYIDKLYPEFSGLSENVLIKAHLSFLKNLCKTRDKKYRIHEKNSIRMIKERKKYFIPALSGDQRMYWIVTHGLYGVYKHVYYPIRKRFFRF